MLYFQLKPILLVFESLTNFSFKVFLQSDDDALDLKTLALILKQFVEFIFFLTQELVVLL